MITVPELKSPNGSGEKVPLRVDQSPFSYLISNYDQSPLNQKAPVIRQLFTQDNDQVEIQNILESLRYLNHSIMRQQSPQGLFPKITKSFYQQEVCKKLDFASMSQRSPNRRQIVMMEEEELECDEEEPEQSNPSSYGSNAYFTFPFLVTKVSIKVDKKDNLCSQCHNAYKASPHKDEDHPITDHLSSQRTQPHRPQEQIQFQDSSDRKYRHLNLITLKKNSSFQQEKQANLSKINSEQQRRQRASDQKYHTIQKRPRKGSIVPAVVSAAKIEIKCNCNKSKCLKLYCDCFAAGQYCGKDCNCCDCSNTDTHNHERRSSMKQILERNPNAFRHKLQSGSEEDVKHFRGCNCKKSNCLKKYCECYQMGVGCSELCKCDDCKNCDSPQKSKKKSRTRAMTIQEPTKQKRMRIC